ncbi:MAG: hypothetical protein ACJAUQ_001757 [Maribacter sp.]|jgi:hypothetical protein
MKYSVFCCSFLFLLFACKQSKPEIKLIQAVWLAELTTLDDYQLPFNFKHAPHRKATTYWTYLMRKKSLLLMKLQPLTIPLSLKLLVS